MSFRDITFIFTLLLCSHFVSAEATLEYFHDKTGAKTINTIQSSTFTPFNQKINEGLNNGAYWIKIKNGK